MAQSNRGHASLGGGRRRSRVAAVAAVAASAVAAAVAVAVRGGGGGGGGRGGGGGGRRSDITLKHDIALLGHLDNGLGFYRFSYNGSDAAYVGVMAQEVQVVMPDAVSARPGRLSCGCIYDRLGREVPDLRSVDRIGRTRPGHGPRPTETGTEDVMNMIHTLTDVLSIVRAVLAEPP